MTAPVFHQLNLIARDIDASVSFYRRLGFAVDADPGDPHVELRLPNGMSIEWDSADSVPMWDSGWRGLAPGGGVVLSFELASREAVNEKYAELTASGHPGHQPPYDAFWGARYAMVEDPDGNSVGLMSPIDNDRKYWPPVPPPQPPA